MLKGEAFLKSQCSSTTKNQHFTFLQSVDNYYTDDNVSAIHQAVPKSPGSVTSKLILDFHQLTGLCALPDVTILILPCTDMRQIC